MRNKHAIIDLLGIRRSDRDLQWLKSSLQAAVELEFATLPPYLAARWSIKNGMDPVARTIRDVTREEMLHMGLGCNLLVAIGGLPILNAPESVPTYPSPLPGGVNPTLIIPLQGLSRDAVRLFMEIEYPESGPIEPRDNYATIGEFYSAIQLAFDTIQPVLSSAGQLAGPLGLSLIENSTQVKQAIDLIRIQGEGTAATPEEAPGDLAHYYRFGEVYHGKRFVRDSQTGTWGYNGAPLTFPDAWPMGIIPAGGYSQGQVTNDVWNLLSQFDQSYTQMINQLHTAWTTGDQTALSDAVGTMFSLSSPAVALMKMPIPGLQFTYGPCFRLS